MRQHVSFAATYGTIMASMVRGVLVTVFSPSPYGMTHAAPPPPLRRRRQVIAFGVFWWGYGTFVRRDEGVPSPERLSCKCSPVVSHYSADDRAGLWRVLKIFAPLPAYWGAS